VSRISRVPPIAKFFGSKDTESAGRAVATTEILLSEPHAHSHQPSNINQNILQFTFSDFFQNKDLAARTTPLNQQQDDRPEPALEHLQPGAPGNQEQVAFTPSAQATNVPQGR